MAVSFYAGASKGVGVTSGAARNAFATPAQVSRANDGGLLLPDEDLKGAAALLPWSEIRQKPLPPISNEGTVPLFPTPLRVYESMAAVLPIVS